MEIQNNSILNAVPKIPDTSLHYLFYLHGLIIEMAGIRPKSEEHGYYEYEMILSRLAAEGFVILSEARGKGTQVKPYAEKIANQINMLMDSGVPPAQITVVGASKGGCISAYISQILKRQDLSFVFLAGLFEKYLEDANLKLYGKVLSIHDRADTLGITPDLYFQRSEGLGTFEKIVVSLDVGHGLIYKPYSEWISPMMEWLKKDRR